MYKNMKNKILPCRDYKIKTITTITVIFLFFTIIFIAPISAHNSSYVSSDRSDSSFLPEGFKVGDLIFIESVSFFQNICNSWDHVAMYIGNNLFIEANDYSEIPRPIGGTVGVQITPLWKYRLWIQVCSFATIRVANETQRLAAVEWALDRRGDDNFQKCWDGESWWANPDPNDETDPDSNNWYCAELIWAAYYNTSNGEIDLDITPGPLPPPSGDGIHFAVNPQNIADHENITHYTDEGAPLSPNKPYGSPVKATLLQSGMYFVNSSNDPELDLSYQWAWGDSYRPDSWGRFVRGGSCGETSKDHFWSRLSIHDRLGHNFVFDVRVRCKDEEGRVSAWSKPLPVHVSPNFFKSDWVSPTGYIDTEWKREKNIVNDQTSTNYAVYKKMYDSEWSDSALILTLEKTILVKGFKIRAINNKWIDKMNLDFYNGSEQVVTLSYDNWPNLRWKYVDLHRFHYEVDSVQISFHGINPPSQLGFFRHPVKVYGFSFWEYTGLT